MTPLLLLSIPGDPQGARRHRVDTRGGRVRTHHDAAHLAAEGAIVALARAEWRAPALDEPVRVVIRTYHRRPARLRTRAHWGDEPGPMYVGKPDADNVAKLVLDALTKAGVWVDDTRVADLRVVRRYVALSSEGVLGVEGTVVEVYRC